MMRVVLAFVRELLAQVPGGEDVYAGGYTDALRQVEEFILDQMWTEGEDDEEA
jgi:hypothetical protein